MRKRLMIKVIMSAMIFGFITSPLLSSNNEKSNNELALTCNNNVQVSLNKMCGGVIPDHLVEGSTVGPFKITLADGQVGNSPNLDTDFEGIDWVLLAKNQGSMKYTIEDGNSNTCWGNITIESNRLPKVESPYATAYSCDSALPFGQSEVAVFKGDITDNLEDDILLDIKWYGVGALDKYYADVVEFQVPIYNTVCGTATFSLSSTFQILRNEYDEITFTPTDGKYLFLNSDNEPIPAPTSLAPGKYKVVIYADHNNGIGSYTAQVIIDEAACTSVPFDIASIVELSCGEPLPIDWVPYDGEKGSGAFLDIMTGSGCGINFTPLPPNESVCGNICDEDGEIHIIKYEILLEQHGQTRLVEVLRQGYRRTQQDMAVCNPIAKLEMPCNSDPSPVGVYEYQKDVYLEKGFSEFEADKLAIQDAYPHLCSKVYLDYEKDVIVVEHEYVDIGTKTELVWKDLNGDGYQDLNEWVEVTIVDKELVEVLVEKTVICKGSDGLSKEEESYGCKLISDIIPLNEKYCGYTISSNETIIQECNQGYKVARSWDLINWCDASIEPIKGAIQTILVRDNEAPILKLVSNTFDGLVEPRSCIVNVKLPEPFELSDNCTVMGLSDISYSVSGIGTVVDGVYIGNLEFGATATVTYSVNDGCGNVAYADLVISPFDATAPVNVCEDNIIVSLTPDAEGGVGKIPATSFDKGSHDYGCGPVTVQVMRMEDFEALEAVTCDPILGEVVLVPESVDKFGEVVDAVTEIQPVFGDYVKFCCADIGNDSLMVVVRVTDLAGNYNDCMVMVEVQDKLSGSIACSNVTITCLDYPDDPYANKPIIVPGVCDDLDLELLSEEVDINSCGAGTIIREWGAIRGDDTLSTCRQLISVTSEGVFDPLSIKWPVHHTNESFQGVNKEFNEVTGLCEITSEDKKIGMKGVLNCSEDLPLCEPVWGDRTCGLVGTTYEDELVNFDAEACIKIIRRWTVIDWCAFEPNSDELLDDANDTEVDKFQLCEDWCETDECHGNVYFRYSEVDYDGYYTFDQILKIVDDIAPVVDCEGISTSSTFDGVACTGSISASASATDTGSGTCASTEVFWNIYLRLDGDIIDSETAISAVNESVEYEATELSEGDYEITFIATDGCGNSSDACEVELSIKDTKAPTPICLQNLSTAVMTEGDPTVEIWAVDFNQKSEDNCTPQDELRYSFSGDSIVPSLAFNCDDVTGFPIELQMWVWDNSDNRDFCFVRLRVDGTEACGAVGNSLVANIGGEVHTEKGDMIEEANVNIQSNQAEYPSSRMTEDDGHYAFMNNPMYEDYALNVVKDDAYMNGVSTLDLVLMNKHVLGLQVLDSPYKVIAADINNSGNVSAMDLVELRNLILGTTTVLSNNTSWRFIDASQTFANPSNPWPFIEEIELYSLEDHSMTEDFIGVKIGDVNGSAKVNQFQTIEVRNRKSVKLSVENAVVAKGEMIDITFTSEEFLSVVGMQFTLNHTGLELKDVIASELDMDFNNVGVFDNLTTVSWDNIDNVDNTVTDLFTLRFLATESVQMEDVLEINSRVTVAELYKGANYEIYDIELQVVDSPNELVSVFEVYQNTPNPFTDETSIGFSLPENDRVTVSVHNVNGQIIYKHSADYRNGRHSLNITNNDINVAGVYYYTVSSEKYSITRKMILMD